MSGRAVRAAAIAALVAACGPALGQSRAATVADAKEASGAVCATDRVDLRGDWGQAQFRIEIADDAAERAQGLMHRETLGRSRGMLFVYDDPRPVSFWMRNTLIPLDMVFVGPDGVVTRVHENAQPLDETPIDGGPGVLAVLEINGGLAGRMGIAEGSQLRHPAFGPDAAWSCDD
ncbi:DUF192 domain-containing protein [Mesobaculum littorinae]|uniref:DUF192 domain-containing protein n=1 Tax=Mesobaculum littorinae TaxID=2486419 RepID=A0A438AJ84_9RHOB|nr:DUF192 domain-containing protein [Mesobaculum littorinae]RVV98841.1 DUF192 domain-containing protein [Mesobaculum littorinae]